MGLAIFAPVAFAAAFVAPLIALNNAEPASQAPPAVPSTSRSASTAAPPPPSSSAGRTTQPQGERTPRSVTELGQTRPGVLVQAQPDAQGNLEVVERVRFGSPQAALIIGPPSLRGVTGDVAQLKPRINELQVSADGELVSVPENSRQTTQTSVLQLPRAARAVVLRYRLENASSRSLPGPPGRALVVLPPINIAPSGTALAMVVGVSGGAVRNLLCPGLDSQHQLCGHAYGASWYTTELPAGRTAVVAQLDLPPPGA